MDAYLTGLEAAGNGRGDENERPPKRVNVGIDTADGDSSGNRMLLDNDDTIVIDIDKLEDEDSAQLDLVGEALTQDGDVEDDDGEQEPAPVQEVNGGDAATFSDNAGELLAYMGLPASARMTWRALFLELCEPGDYSNPLRGFLDNCRYRSSYRGRSAETVNAFLDREDRDSWATHDARIDVEWAPLAAEIVNLSQNTVALGSLSKPSGPLNAVLTMNWHFPTWSTRAPLWSHVMDPTNPSLRAQKEKYGLNSLIRTQNRLPIREHYKNGGVNWEETYPNWTAIEEKCLEFNRTLNRHSKLILVLGTENVRSYDKLIEHDEMTEELIQVKLQIPMVKVFGEQPNFTIIQNRATKEVRQVVFFSYHSQTFFARNVDMRTRAYHDFLWNAVADMAMINSPPSGDMHFTRQANIVRPANGANKFKDSQLQLAIRLRANEKRTGVILPEGAVRHAFNKTLSKRPDLLLVADNTGSYVRTVLGYFVAKGQRMVNDPEWRKTTAYDRMYASHLQNLENNREVMLARGRQTRQTDAYKASESGMYATASLVRSAALPRNKQAERVAALYKVKQVQELRDADTATLDVKQRAMQDRIRNLSTMDKKKLGSFFRQYVIWWAPWHPRGLRYEGDGCQEPDTFDYDSQEHPAVQVSRAFKSHEKRAFVVESSQPAERQQEDPEDE